MKIVIPLCHRDGRTGLMSSRAPLPATELVIPVLLLTAALTKLGGGKSSLDPVADGWLLHHSFSGYYRHYSLVGFVSNFTLSTKQNVHFLLIFNSLSVCGGPMI